MAGNQISSTAEHAKLALAQVSEWAKWMSAIHTAALAFLAGTSLNLSSLPPAKPPSHWEIWIAGIGLAALAVALLLSAWLLASVVSLLLRLEQPAEAAPAPTNRKVVADKDKAALDTYASYHHYDIYAMPIFTWLGANRVNLGVLMALQHWAWGTGLASMAAFYVLRFTGSR